MSPLRAGDIVVTEGDDASWSSRAVMWATRSRWTHVFLVTAPGEAVESWFPTGVRYLDPVARLADQAREGRRWRVLAKPALADWERAIVATTARSWVGRRYDHVQALLFGLTRLFYMDGPKRMHCGRLVTAAYHEAGIDLFPAAELQRRLSPDDPRYHQLRRGWATPHEILSYSATALESYGGAAPLVGDYAS